MRTRKSVIVAIAALSALAVLLSAGINFVAFRNVDPAVFRIAMLAAILTPLCSAPGVLAITCVLIYRLNMAKDRIEQMAFIDPLTQLHNRKILMGDTCPDGTVLPSGRPYCALMADVDHFKRINDEHGHATGDRVLIRIADLLRRRFPTPAVVVRTGGEEFAVILPETGLREARERADRVRLDAETLTLAGEDGTFTITLSIGIAAAKAGTPVMDALSRADKALYAAKHGGRNLCRTEPPAKAA